MEILDTILEDTIEPIYAATLLIALIKYPKYYNTLLKYFPILLMYTFLTEILGHITRNYDVYNISIFSSFVRHNVIIYNIYNIIFFSYFFYVYWSFIKNKVHKRYILYGSLFYMSVSLINPFLQNFKFEPQMYSYLMGAVIIVFCIILFFIDLKNTKEKLDFSHTGIKWISIGLLLFYIGYFPIKISGYKNYLNLFTEYIHLRRIHLILIIIMYLCFIVGFLRMKRKFWI